MTTSTAESFMTKMQSDPLKIAFVTETYPPEVNGVASTLARFINGLKGLSHHITLIRPRQGRGDTPKIEPYLREILTQGVPIPGYSSLKLGLPQQTMLMKEWMANRPDLVHIVTEGPLGWSALEVARKLKIPVCSDFRTNFDAYSSHYGLSWLKIPIQKYLRYFHNRTSFTMVPTEGLKNTLHLAGFERLKVLARGVDTHLFNPAKRSLVLRQEWGVTESDEVVIYVGRLASEKNLQLTVQAFKAMLKIKPNLKIVWVGDGPQKKWLELHCPNSIFVGVKSGEDLARHYASGDIFLFSSLSETFGNVTLEAMASGLAVVAYDYAAASQVIRHKENGILVPCNDPGSFIEQGVELLKNRQDIQSLGSSARKSTLEISWESVTGKLDRKYHELLLNYVPVENSNTPLALGNVCIK
ncbi:MAG TPA: glycosyltransferase family 1 protein [Polynucleobacter sp.]|nr:glycosyltransferase family 1 protein [Polynucleobacter sp.]HQS60111.1 glycosyltransferase family 1 protein [Polynucleobacter sp.]HQT20329.1 glycosyltransferase family 1 protein [Polynucleobacter sp.]HQT40516.1 glycosyltransferase family 1 protein [Polynucleobacter sp.]